MSDIDWNAYQDALHSLPGYLPEPEEEGTTMLCLNCQGEIEDDGKGTMFGLCPKCAPPPKTPPAPVYTQATLGDILEAPTVAAFWKGGDKGEIEQNIATSAAISGQPAEGKNGKSKKKTRKP